MQPVEIDILHPIDYDLKNFLIHQGSLQERQDIDWLVKNVASFKGFYKHISCEDIFWKKKSQIVQKLFSKEGAL